MMGTNLYIDLETAVHGLACHPQTTNILYLCTVGGRYSKHGDLELPACAGILCMTLLASTVHRQVLTIVCTYVALHSLDH